MSKMFSNLCVVFVGYIGVISVVLGCDCRYWSDYTYGYPLDMCTYNYNNNVYTSVFTECQYNDKLSEYVLKQTLYSNSETCNGNNSVVNYYTYSDGYNFNCESSKLCDFAAEYVLNNNEYNRNGCGNSDRIVISKEYKVMSCCFETNSASYYSSCMKDTIVTTEYFDGISNCHNGSYSPVMAITGFTATDGVRFERLSANGDDIILINGPFYVGRDPSALVVNSENNKVYIAKENWEGMVYTIAYDNEFNKISEDTITSHGRYPTYISKNGNYIYAGNLGSGAELGGFVVYTLDNNGNIIKSAYIVFNDPVGRVHSILSHPNDPKQIYIADIGRHRVEHYYYNTIFNKIIYKSGVYIGDGSGPRTIVFNPIVNGVLYVSRERDNKVSVISFDIDTYILGSVTQTLSTLLSVPVMDAQFVGHCVTDKWGKYLYVTNRVTINSIAIFKINYDGRLDPNSLIEINSGGFVPRYIDVDPTNKYALVANMGEWGQHRGNITVFEIDHNNNGYLNELSNHEYSKLGPSWIDFILDFNVITTPNINGECLDNNNMLTDTQTIIMCNQASPSINSCPCNFAKLNPDLQYCRSECCGIGMISTTQIDGNKWEYITSMDDLECSIKMNGITTDKYALTQTEVYQCEEELAYITRDYNCTISDAIINPTIFSSFKVFAKSVISGNMNTFLVICYGIFIFMTLGTIIYCINTCINETIKCIKSIPNERVGYAQIPIQTNTDILTTNELELNV